MQSNFLLATALLLPAASCAPPSVQVSTGPAQEQTDAGQIEPIERDPEPPPPIPVQPTLKWVDRTGAYVSQSPSPVHVDSAGRIWPLSIESAQVALAEAGSILLFLEPSCQGPAYISAFQPRLVFAISGQSKIRPDTLESASLVAQSATLNGTCSDSLFPLQFLIPVSGLLNVSSPPSLPYSPPLRQQF